MPLDTSTYALTLLRLDGRRWNELRRLTGSISTQASADGSSYLSLGNTQVLCTVTGPAEIRTSGMPSSSRPEDRAGIHVSISVAGFSSTDRRSRSGGAGADRRMTELQTQVQATLSAAVFLERYPRSTIAVALHVLAADGGVLAACVNAATLALVDAGVPMADYVCACNAGCTANTLAFGQGKGGGPAGADDGQEETDPLLDLNAQEELEVPSVTVATLGATEKVLGLALETKVRVERVEGMLAVAVDGCKQVREILDGIVRTHGKALLENSVG